MKDGRRSKQIAREKYAERQIDKFVKWSWNMRGKVKYKDIVKLHEEHNIKVYARNRERRE